MTEATEPPEPLAPSGLPLAWLACETASDCTFVHRNCSSDHCAGNLVPVARAHEADARRIFPRRPCAHGYPGHGCPLPSVACRDRTCAVRARPPETRDPGDPLLD